ncbi:hypothetical protein AMTR_s00088p00096220 [Amborella trichopoda]|uniref:Uncharacterized protein n=1 Tax=Amborella trichopoda TaxID=13333 RepID=W1NW32_AMBTC|nr:hypothetical protein AMTR_s00088p00096220 [Amborella trichopoda]
MGSKMLWHVKQNGMKGQNGEKKVSHVKQDLLLRIERNGGIDGDKGGMISTNNGQKGNLVKENSRSHEFWGMIITNDGQKDKLVKENSKSHDS